MGPERTCRLKMPAEMDLLQIEVTNICTYACSNCTRCIGHHKRSYAMDAYEVREALRSLEGYNGHIGMMGGDPLLHPKYAKLCELYREHVPVKARRELWTAGHNWEKYLGVTEQTFYEELVAFNDHSKVDECWHQPLLVGIEEVVEDEEKMWKMIGNCWINQRWSASINPRGAYFCEIAAARAMIDPDAPDGLPVIGGWWGEPQAAFQRQIEWACPKCSACLPMETRINSHESFDLVSPKNYVRLDRLGSPKIRKNMFRIPDMVALKDYASRDMTPIPEHEYRGGYKEYPGWTPWNYRSAKWHAPGEGTMTPDEVRHEQGLRRTD